jgi:hypothetical protein
VRKDVNGPAPATLTGQEAIMTDQTGYDPAEDPDTDPGSDHPDSLNPRTGGSAGPDSSRSES